MFDRLLVLSFRVFFTTVAVNMIAYDQPFWNRVMATAALALIPSVR